MHGDRLGTGRTAWRLGWLLVAAAAAALTACVTDTPSPGGSELRHHHWWSFYERGAALMREGRPAEARPDFERCLGLRAGATYAYDRDTWRARTYGMHVLDDYFPKRELGICLYEAGDATGAVRYLERSLAQTPSGRAKHYLNLARRRLLKGVAAPPPEIRLDPGAATPWTSERSRTVSGSARGAGYVAALSVNGRARFLELAEREVRLDQAVPLSPGTNWVEIEAVDLAGQHTVRRVVWVADWQPPELLVRRVAQDGGWRLEGRVRDDCGLKSVHVDGVPLMAADAEGLRTEVPLQLKLKPDGAARCVAVDVAGNVLESILSPAAWPDLSDANARTEDFPAVAAAGTADVEAPSSALRAADRMHPSLRVSGDEEPMVVGREDFFLDGQADDGGGLASVTVNGEERIREPERGSQLAHFSRPINLALGTNVFEVIATDLAGNRTRASRTVVRRRPECLEGEYRLRVGLPLPDPNPEPELAALVRGHMESRITDPPARFALKERGEALDLILREHAIGLSKLGDEKAALKIGKFAPVDLLLAYAVLRQGRGVTVRVRAVETSGAELLAADDVYSEGGPEDLEAQVRGLVLKIDQRFPLAFGEIVALHEGRATLNLGRSQGVMPGLPFMVVLRPESGDVMDGVVRKVNGKAVQVTVGRVRPATAEGVVEPADAASVVKRGDYAFAR